MDDDSLPSSFDLFYDIKSRAELVEKMRQARDFLEHCRELLKEHCIVLTVDEEAEIVKGDK